MEKKITDSIFEKKLLAYSIAAGAVLAGTGDTQAGIWGKSENKTLADQEKMTISFNGNDRFVIWPSNGYGCISVKTANARWFGLSNTTGLGRMSHYNQSAIPLILNDQVGPGLVKSGGVFTNNTALTKSIFTGNKTFGNGSDRFVGVKFKIGENAHYGWIKLNVPAPPHHTWTVVSYAYETIPDTPIACDGVLPVELNSFTGELTGSSVSLRWKTATEVNNHGFEVERKTAANAGWEKIGFVEGHGNSNSPLNYSYADAKAPKGSLSYRLKQIDNDGKYTYSSIVEVANNIVEKFELAQNYPNPFNPSTKIKFSLPEKSQVSLSVFNSLGQEVSTLVNGELEAGSHETFFNASGLPSGVYVYKINAGKYSEVRKMMMIK